MAVPLLIGAPFLANHAQQQASKLAMNAGNQAQQVAVIAQQQANLATNNAAKQFNNAMASGAQHVNNGMVNGAQLAHGLVLATGNQVDQSVTHAAGQVQTVLQTAEGNSITIVQQAGAEGQSLVSTASKEFCMSIDHTAGTAQTLCVQGSHAAAQNFLLGFFSAFMKPLVKAVNEELRKGSTPDVIMDLLFRQGPTTKPSESRDALAAALDHYALSGLPSLVVFVLQLSFLREAEKRGMLVPSLWSWMMKLLRLSEDPRQWLMGKLVHLPQEYDATGAVRASAIDALVNTNETVAIVRHLVQLGCGGMVPLPPVADVEIDKDLMIVPVLRETQTIHTFGNACDAKNGYPAHLYKKCGPGHQHVDNNVWKFSADGKIHASSRPELVLSKKGLPTDPLSDGVPVHLWKEHGHGDPNEKNQLFLFYDGYIALAADPTYVLTVAGDGSNNTKLHLAKRVPESHPDHKKQLWKTADL